MMIHFTQIMSWEISGTSAYHNSLEFIKTPGNTNVELVEMYLPYLRWVIFVMNCFRLVLVIISFKYPAVCKYYVYY